jgi:hypothetical protein
VETLYSHYEINNETLDDLLSDGPMRKQAQDSVQDFTRTQLREGAIREKVLPSLPIRNDQLDRQLHTDKPYKVIDKEPSSPAAKSIPFGTTPDSVYIRGVRYPVMFDRTASIRFIKDVDELRTYHMDIRQVLSDNSLKDMLAEDDAKTINAVNSALIAPDVPIPWSGQPQWVTLAGGWTRDTYVEMLNIMPDTDASLPVETILCNHISFAQMRKWRRDEMGGDFAQSILKDGQVDDNYDQKNWVVTIKKRIVPTNAFYMFAAPKYLGKSFVLQDTVMYVKRDGPMIEFYFYHTKGATFGHTGGLARADII